MSVVPTSELHKTIRFTILWAAIAAIFYTYRITYTPEIGQVVVRLPNECANTINIKGQEFVRYDCFRSVATAKIEREESPYDN